MQIKQELNAFCLLKGSTGMCPPYLMNPTGNFRTYTLLKLLINQRYSEKHTIFQFNPRMHRRFVHASEEIWLKPGF